jgi:diguanylate cyclase (GGDEF)-like protein
MHRKILQADFFWPLCLVMILTTAVMAAATFALVGRFDGEVRAREEAIVSNGWDVQVADIAHRVVPQAAWDDAVLHLDNRFDPDWARDNIGAYLKDVGKFSWSMVLDHDDRPAFFSDGDAAEARRRLALIDAGAAKVVRDVREAEAARGRLHIGPSGRFIAEPIQSSTLVKRGDKVELLTATLVQPDFGRAFPRRARSAVVLTALEFDQAFFTDFASRFMLEGLHRHRNPSEVEPAHASLALRDASGRVLEMVAWTPQRPGLAMLRQAFAPAGAVLIALFAAMAHFYVQGRRVAQGLIASEARALHLAHHDALTGLPNRIFLYDRLSRAVDPHEGMRDVAVICVDLDRFKEVNDTFGHQAGDELIRMAARRMVEVCREGDIVGRLSGDEFVIIQMNGTRKSAESLAARLCERMIAPFDLSAGRAFAGCTLGITFAGDTAREATELLRQADLALYSAKQSDKGWFRFFEPEMDADLQSRRALEIDLREAIDREAFEMVYQPQVDQRGVMVGVEALVRWTHPERGEISPSYFVPVAEECGLIADLGMLTLRRAFIDARRWNGLKVAVNVSAAQLRLADFVDEIGDLVEELNVDPSQFELEITEGILLGDDVQTQETLRRLRSLGFSLALDDFGTGYSSLSYLRRYPISKIKIDRSFITSLGVDAEAEAVVAAIVRLARALRLSVIAEGVETTDQRDRLSAAGCSEVQGFLYGRPVRADEIDRLRARRDRAIEHAA